MQKANYGIDAPGVIRNLVIVSVAALLLAIFFPTLSIGAIKVELSGFIWLSVACGLMALWMFIYSRYGKLKHRDRILNMVNWKGDEKVLDVGTGSGLLAIGAARRLTTGRSTGIDIWNQEDLTKNKMESTLRNAAMEGVGDKIEIRNENAMAMSFEDNSFDIVVSNLCLHNIYNSEGRRKACREISRVLKRGGVGIISDFKHMKEYKNVFMQAGLQAELLPASPFKTFPPLAILKVTKT